MPGKAAIKATALPPVVDQARCPVRGRTIVDAGGLRAEFPEPGTGAFVEAYGVCGSQEFEVSNPRGGTFTLRQVGGDAEAFEPGVRAARTIAPRAIGNGCGDGAHNPDPANTGERLYRDLSYRVNAGTIPGNVDQDRAIAAIREGNQDISQVVNPCGVGDGVPRTMVYEGTTDASTGIGVNRSCDPDTENVVGFGDLEGDFVAWHCGGTYPRDGQDEIGGTDIRLNSADYNWTAEVTSACSGRYDIEATMAHERGHSYGFDHVREAEHGVLTMSAKSEGPCQTSERSLGLGDARGLNQKYP